MPSSQRADGAPRDRMVAGSVLVLVVLVAFWPVLGGGFVGYDDELYVTHNDHVRSGVTAGAVRWALTSGRAANWHPLTWLSHMIDWQLFGPLPAGHHLTSLLLHLANTVLLFLVLARMTRAVAPSAVVAALFGVHPLHVESVAWLAQRKDVLSTWFWLLALLAYASYAAAPSVRRMFWVAVALALGLAAKPMLVSLPLTLLLLDYWPLGRYAASGSGAAARRVGWGLVREKLPLLLIAATSALVTFQVQRGGGAVVPLDRLAPLTRASNALVSYAAYLGKAIWPTGLAVFYPYRSAATLAWEAAGAAVVLGAVSWVALRERRRRPYLIVGWLWYLVTLLPVIGLVQVGNQARADRYTYMPLVGVFLIATWGAGDLLRSFPRRAPEREGTSAWMLWPAGIVVAILVVCTRVQAAYWRDPVDLFEHALAVTDDNHVAHFNLGNALVARGQAHEALEQYTQAIQISPGFPDAHNNLGLLLAQLGRPVEAANEYTNARRIDPDHPEARYNLGNALFGMGRVGEAEEQFRRALLARPDFAEAHNNLGWALATEGRSSEAVAEYAAAIGLRPDYATAHANLGMALATSGSTDAAAAQFSAALRAAADDPATLRQLGATLTEHGQAAQGVVFLESACRARPEDASAHSNLAAALYLTGRYAEAWEQVRLARVHGFEPPARLIETLTARLPEPSPGQGTAAR